MRAPVGRNHFSKCIDDAADRLLSAAYCGVRGWPWPAPMRSAVLAVAAESLPPRAWMVLILRFGLDGHEGGRTLKQTAIYTPRVATSRHPCPDGHVTIERIRQMEAKALRMLRHPARRNRIIATALTEAE